MKSFFLFVTIICIQIQLNFATINLNTFREQALEAHNYYRRLHGAQPIALNSTINDIAQAYAENLAASDAFEHSDVSDLGENLWTIMSSVAITDVNGLSPVNSWYDEISAYDFANPGFSSETGHFTQVIWNDSVQFGIGIAFTTGDLKAKVVANYYPQGNYAGEFAANVFPTDRGNRGGD